MNADPSVTNGDSMAPLATLFTRHGGHPGGSSSTLRILQAYRSVFSPRDILLSSKGHDAAAFLWFDVSRGLLDPVDLTRYRAVNGYPGHPERGVTPGAWVSTGSLGMGLSKAIGLAKALPDRRVFCIVGDGELQEGQVWEAAHTAARLGLDNLIVFLDHNGRQSDNRELPVPFDRWTEGVFKAACWTVGIHEWGAPPALPIVPGWPTCILVHGQKDGPHATSTPGPMVLAYARELRTAMQADPRLVVLEADLAGDFGLTLLDQEFPGRVFACGIGEQNMVSMAVGLAAGGLVPVVHTFERFFYRAAEQVLDACQEPGLVIRYVGGLAGPLPQGPGRSHELPDAQLQALFPMPHYAPRHLDTLKECVQSMLVQPRSTYLRLLAQPQVRFTV